MKFVLSLIFGFISFSICCGYFTPSKECLSSRREVLTSSIGGILGITITPSKAHGIASAKDQNIPTNLAATSAGRKGCTTNTDPSRTIVTCRDELLTSNSDGRLSSIAATANGVSTSAIRNPSRYSPPWSYLTETEDATVAWKSLIRAVQSVPNVNIVTMMDTDSHYYLHAVAPTVCPPGIPNTDDAALDDLEFVLRPDDKVVLYRSASRTSVFLYPLTQPISDRNSNLKRLEQIRETLGWIELGDPQQGSQPI
jgi:uncharacterized protein (DUF1499 family)